ncbi:imelysin family protein [Pelagibius marinus]|uniref:imelysin family protein n=1 Tax=Pelagibius marinus TaxID=2762760 RepID=UPI00187260B5|nr:imelysin family protein [Pelagibius marinus]
MRFWRGPKTAAMILLLVLGGPASPAAAATPDYAALNAAVVDNYVIPRYAAFAERTAVLEASLREACADDRLETGESAAAYNDAMDAWMAVQHLRFGPALLLLRYDRIAFWPDKRGTVRRHLAQMLSERDPKALEPQTFANGSVAVQGFPALERLLYDSEDAVWATPFGCRLAMAIGRNLHGIAEGLLADWRDGETPYAQVVKSAAQGNAHYFDTKEASLEFAKALRGALLLVEDYKLGRPLGDDAESAREKRAESWRSARSLRNVLGNLRAARALYRDTGGISFSALLQDQPKGAELDRVIGAALDRLVAAVEAQPDSLVAALKAPDGWEKLDAVRVETGQLMRLLSGPLSEVLDLPIGFNSYDGD